MATKAVKTIAKPADAKSTAAKTITTAKPKAKVKAKKLDCKAGADGKMPAGCATPPKVPAKTSA